MAINKSTVASAIADARTALSTLESAVSSSNLPATQNVLTEIERARHAIRNAEHELLFASENAF